MKFGEWMDAHSVADMINDALGTSYQSKHAWGQLKRAGIEPSTFHGKKMATAAQVGRYLRWRANPRDRLVNTSFTVNATGSSRLTESDIAANRRRIAEMEQQVRAGKLRPVYLPCAHDTMPDSELIGDLLDLGRP